MSFLGVSDDGNIRRKEIPSENRHRPFPGDGTQRITVMMIVSVGPNGKVPINPVMSQFDPRPPVYCR